LDDAVDSPVTTLSQRLPSVDTRSAVPHRHKQVNDELLEEGRWCLADIQQKGLRQLLPQELVGAFKLLFWALCGQRLLWNRDCADRCSDGRLLGSASAILELLELGILSKQLDVNPLGL